MAASKTKINFTTFLISCCLAVGNTLASSLKATAVQLYKQLIFLMGLMAVYRGLILIFLVVI